MYRKRKIPSPFFRVSTPFNPVPGQELTLSSSRPTCRFVLDEDLSTDDDKGYAYITHQYGPGIIHSYDNKICVLNPLAFEEEDCEEDCDQTYAFSGSEGDGGLAVWDTDNNWLIISMLTQQQWFVGKVVEEEIDSESCGTVVQCVYDVEEGAWHETDKQFDVYNPHDVAWPVDFKVMWFKVPGWENCGDCETDWLISPWHFTEC